MFKTYDKLNNVVQENLYGMRVVKSFNRQDHEIEKFKKTSGEIYVDFSKAEKTMAFNMPLMQFCMYASMLLISWFGARAIVASGNDAALGLSTGELISLITYAIDVYKRQMLVLSHFKGHPMGGYGGSLKQLSIGCSSSFGKAYIHGAGVPQDIWTAEQDKFLESMADAAYSVDKYFKGKIAYINVMCNLSVDCDCCAVAEDPCMKDIGILASLDPIAVDQACIDFVYNSDDPGRDHLVERIERQNGVHTIESVSYTHLDSKKNMNIRPTCKQAAATRRLLAHGAH